MFCMCLLLNCNKYTYKTIYNQLDVILYLEVKKYFNPDEEQKKFAKQKLSELLKWNNETQLSEYRVLLVYMKKAIQKGLTEENLLYFYQTFDQKYEILIDKAAPDAADFVMTLRKDQMENFKTEVVQHRKEDDKRHQSESGSKDPLTRNAQSTAKFLSTFYGTFSDQQTEKIHIYMKNIDYTHFDRWEYQSFRQNEFVQLVNNKADKDTMTQFLKNWMTRNYDSLPEPYRERFKSERRFNINLYLYVDNNIVTEKQRANAAKTADNWIQIIDAVLSDQ